MQNSHSLGVVEILESLAATSDGLTSEEARARLGVHGLNRLPDAQKPSRTLTFLGFFADVVVYIFLGAAALEGLLGEWVGAIILAAAAVLNATSGFVVEERAAHAIRGLDHMLSAHAYVLRNETWGVVDAVELVPGDIVRLGPGDKVPADARLLQAKGLWVDETALTGEAALVSKTPVPVDAGADLKARSSMVYSGTTVEAGNGVGVVTATGTATEIAAIPVSIVRPARVETPVTRRLRRLGTGFSVMVLALSVVLSLISRFAQNSDAHDVVSVMIGFAVAAIPESLPALVALAVAFGAQSMDRHNAVIRKLDAIDTLGSVSVICSDKTGTLTKNEMMASMIVTGKREFSISGVGYAPVGTFALSETPVNPKSFPDLLAVVEAASVCNDAQISADESECWSLDGDPTEGALYTLGAKAGLDAESYSRTAALPFDSAHKYMATLNKTPQGEAVFFVKGAPDMLLALSDTQLSPNGKIRALEHEYWLEKVRELGARGLRVLAAASKVAPVGANRVQAGDVESGLTFRGLVGIVDPPRPEAVAAIAECHRGGVSVVMVTGDHAGTARAIAQKMGIIHGQDEAILTGRDLEEMTDERLEACVPDVHIVARTRLEQKGRLVSALQSSGHVVAITGEGLGDAAALRKADVGIALGVRGTEVAKDVADVVLVDDNFASIEHAIGGSRRIFDNIRKVLAVMLPTNGAQALLVLFAVLGGFALPLQPTQIVWVSLLTATALALPLACGPAEPAIMGRPPRKQGRSIVTPRLVSLASLLSLGIVVAVVAAHAFAQSQGASVAVMQSYLVQTLVFAQTFSLFSFRFMGSSGFTLAQFDSGWAPWIAAGVVLVLQGVFLYVPVMNDGFGSAPLPEIGWMVPAALGALVFCFAEAVKAALFRGGRSLD